MTDILKAKKYCLKMPYEDYVRYTIRIFFWNAGVWWKVKQPKVYNHTIVFYYVLQFSNFMKKVILYTDPHVFLYVYFLKTCLARI